MRNTEKVIVASCVSKAAALVISDQIDVLPVTEIREVVFYPVRRKTL
jgi:hypothetical protein